MSEGLPKGWEIVSVAEVIEDFQPGFASGEKTVEGGVAHLRMNNIGLRGDLVLDLVRTVPEKLAKPHHDLRPGDVLVCTTNSGKLVGKCAYFDLPGRYAFSNHLTRLRPKSDIMDGGFLRWNLWLHWKRGLFDDRCKHWVNQSTIPKDVLLETGIVVPPLTEQRRIVAKLGTLLGRVVACQQRLAKVPAILRRFRQAVLSAACSGRLTAEWREENPDTEPADALLCLMCGQEAKYALCDKAYDTPADWAWVHFGALITTIRGGSTVPPQNEPTAYPVLRSSSVRPGFIDLADVRYALMEESRNEDNYLRDGDLLFTRLSGSLEYLANCALVRCLGDRRIQYPDRIFCARLKDPAMAPYVEICFANPSLRAELTEGAKSSAGHQRVSITDIRAQRMPLPPLPEQQEIARRVEGLFALADQIEARLNAAQRQVDSLTPSLLAKAFRGELVPQDPNDEPAAALVERARQCADRGSSLEKEGGQRKRSRPRSSPRRRAPRP